VGKSMDSKSKAKLNEATTILSELLKSKLEPKVDLKIVEAQEILLHIQYG
jgi:hypothetical protein